jgi:hypothetical protein
LKTPVARFTLHDKKHPNHLTGNELHGVKTADRGLEDLGAAAQIVRSEQKKTNKNACSETANKKEKGLQKIILAHTNKP